MAYDNNLSGILTRNSRKSEDKHPDYQGSCEIDGRQFWLSAWIKEGKPDSKLAGQKFFSMKFKEKEPEKAATPADAASMTEPTKTAPKTPAPAASQENLDEDVPF